MSRACPYQGSAPERPKGQRWKPKACASTVKDLCHQAEGSTLKPENDAHGEDQSPLMRTEAISCENKDPSSPFDENSQVRIRKISYSKLLENQ
ncbi:hypothetical protein H920_18310 [Fukomys damarensis]|uniref:Uncharacterized protein n=1 Tax=Fukomys damarensis TaxID=885580 RepID=A0A091CR97_FUKDA|nr:hypothetical protein H920_18310 [Fukomys damarensis]